MTQGAEAFVTTNQERFKRNTVSDASIFKYPPSVNGPDKFKSQGN